mmetsp:Transcript_20487/g.32485  ORF Transcript_20487/g.32485 Transcript_20487/m.32485 type:complete len:93 (-) Transcript_20487:800-1078(-)
MPFEIDARGVVLDEVPPPEAPPEYLADISRHIRQILALKRDDREASGNTAAARGRARRRQVGGGSWMRLPVGPLSERKGEEWKEGESGEALA